jgi:hypothetical protein
VRGISISLADRAEGEKFGATWFRALQVKSMKSTLRKIRDSSLRSE